MFEFCQTTFVGLVPINALAVTDRLLVRSRLPGTYPHVPIWITSGSPTIRDLSFV